MVLLNIYFFHLPQQLTISFFWITFFTENWVFQLLFLFTLFYFSSTKNIYHALFYFFFLIIEIGCFFCLINFELFSGFLWLIEFTVFFVLLILFFFLNHEGFEFQNFLKLSIITGFWFFWNVLLWIYLFWCFFIFENSILTYLCINEFYENFFISSTNFILNDFFSLKLSYYDINAVEFCLFCLFLVFGSFICVNLYKLKISFSLLHISQRHNFLIQNFYFFRKQVLTSQSNSIPAIRIFKRKINATKG